jgi:RNA polymerase sigma-70 factor (ECF subfamily)
LLALVQEGRSHAEIAVTLRSSVAAVKARLHRAREHLREHYQSPHEN